MDEEDDDTIYQLTWECTKLFEKCRTLKSPTADDLEWIEEREADFRWWAYGLKASKTGHSSLDFRVRSRPDIRSTIIGLINGISDVLDGYLRDDEASSSGDVDRLPMSQSRYYIQTNTDLLIEISLAIVRSGAKFRHLRADKALASATTRYTALKQHVSSLLLVQSYEWSLITEVNDRACRQELPLSVAIVVRSWLRDPSRLTRAQESLVQGVLVRNNRINFARKPWPIDIDEPDRGKDIGRQGSHGTSPRSQLIRTPRHAGGPTEELPLHLRDSEFSKFHTVSGQLPPNLPEHRSGFDLQATGEPVADVPRAFMPAMAPSSAALSSFTSNTFSYTATGIGSSFQMPGLPREQEAIRALTVKTRMALVLDYPLRPCPPAKGSSFKCPYCCQILQKDYLDTQTRWRAHVAYDLMPYTCIFDACGQSTEFYRTRYDWIEHMKGTHGLIKWICEACPVQRPNFTVTAFGTFEDWKSHTDHVHGIQVSPARETMARKMNARTMLNPTRCPACPRSFELRSLEEDDHIAEHLHSLALMALPWDGNPDADLSDGPMHSGGPLVPQGSEQSRLVDRSLEDATAEEAWSSRDSQQSGKHEENPTVPDNDFDVGWFRDLMLSKGFGTGNAPPSALLKESATVEGQQMHDAASLGSEPIISDSLKATAFRLLASQYLAIVIVTRHNATVPLSIRQSLKKFIFPIFSTDITNLRMSLPETLSERLLDSLGVFINNVWGVFPSKPGSGGNSREDVEFVETIHTRALAHVPDPWLQPEPEGDPRSRVKYLAVATCLEQRDPDSNQRDIAKVSSLIVDYLDGFDRHRGRSPTKLSSSRTRMTEITRRHVRIIDFGGGWFGDKLLATLQTQGAEASGNNTIHAKVWDGGTILDELLGFIDEEVGAETQAIALPRPRGTAPLGKGPTGVQEVAKVVQEDKEIQEPPKANVPPMYRFHISTYRLRRDRLEAYLGTLFPDYPKHLFDVQLSEDGNEFWEGMTPRPLTNRERDFIARNVRLSLVSRDGEFL